MNYLCVKEEELHSHEDVSFSEITGFPEMNQTNDNLSSLQNCPSIWQRTWKVWDAMESRNEDEAEGNKAGEEESKSVDLGAGTGIGGEMNEGGEGGSETIWC
ncbi:unnamed protein product [Microthlaspi erraticum]|uniref:Uncharacterized protein n=1 Tax=Microthlaspi erraticum TaxID=1685480 RepID=A0A6D2KGF9_9BRAS|nr:unnamed protein product [Microthlaspi erraticum]